MSDLLIIMFTISNFQQYISVGKYKYVYRGRYTIYYILYTYFWPILYIKSSNKTEP